MIKVEERIRLKSIMAAAIVKKANGYETNTDQVQCIQNILGLKKDDKFIDSYNNEYEIITFDKGRFSKRLLENTQYAMFVKPVYPNTKRRIGITAAKNIMKINIDDAKVCSYQYKDMVDEILLNNNEKTEEPLTNLEKVKKR